MTFNEFNQIRLSIPLKNFKNRFNTEEVRYNNEWTYYMADGGYTQVLTNQKTFSQYILNPSNNTIKEEKLF